MRFFDDHRVDHSFLSSRILAFYIPLGAASCVVQYEVVGNEESEPEAKTTSRSHTHIFIRPLFLSESRT